MMHFYSLSTDLRNWKESHCYHYDILEYWQDLTEKYDLYPNIVFNHKVVNVEWNDELKLYHVTIEDFETGVKTATEAHVVISSIGTLNIPHWPDIPGLSKFEGVKFHSAEWNHDVDLRGKRVAVIGGASTAIQIVPCISRDPSVHVTNFVRTPTWIMPSPRAGYSTLRRWLNEHVPGALWINRFSNFLLSELLYLLVFSNSISRKLMQWASAKYMRSAAPEEYHERLMPKHSMGCRRLLFDSDYLASLHRPNVSLCFEGIKELVEDGIITKNDEILDFDVVIGATGFSADNYPVYVKGREKRTINEYYRASGGPTAYLGTTIPGFPNFFMLGGPNITTGHASAIYSYELQSNYILQLVKPILVGRMISVEVKSEATDEYNANVQKRLSKSVFVHCINWYRVGGDGKVAGVFPGSSTLMWWWLRRPVWSHYEIVGRA
ncbi:hypothetical protein AX15_005919 [Amanita polypyramis BW_CC]|nr:hypothetical protein AX15_005919 [Amanita polypyramis BW_CC]